MGYCTACGQKHDDDLRYCTACGAKLPKPTGHSTRSADDRPKVGEQVTAPAASTATAEADDVARPPVMEARSAAVEPWYRRNRWIVISVLIVAAVSALGAVVVLADSSSDEMGLGADDGEGISGQPAASVTIISLQNGDSVAADQRVRVAVFLSGFDETVSVTLVVDGSAVDEPSSSETPMFTWRPRADMGSALLQAFVTRADGTTVSSDPVRVSIVASAKPTPTGTSADDDSAAQADSSKGLPPTPFYGAFYCAFDDLSVAQSMAAEGQAAGFDTLVLNTIDYHSLGKAGQSIWVVCAGPYETYAAADAAAADLRKSGFAGAYAKVVE